MNTSTATAIVSPKLRLDAHNYRLCLAQIREKISAQVAELVIDLSEVMFIDNHGLSVIVKGYQLARDARIPFRVVGVKHPAVKVIFDVTRIEQLFPVKYGVDSGE